jgi:hypothetical protein
MTYLPNELINIIFSYRQPYPYIKELNDSINQHKNFSWYNYQLGGVNIKILLMIIKKPNQLYYFTTRPHCGK